MTISTKLPPYAMQQKITAGTVQHIDPNYYNGSHIKDAYYGNSMKMNHAEMCDMLFSLLDIVQQLQQKVYELENRS